MVLVAKPECLAAPGKQQSWSVAPLRCGARRQGHNTQVQGRSQGPCVKLGLDLRKGLSWDYFFNGALGRLGPFEESRCGTDVKCEWTAVSKLKFKNGKTQYLISL